MTAVARWCAAGIGAAALVACRHRDRGEDAVVTSGTCIVCEAPRTTGSLSSDEMDETSGLAASSRSSGVFFANNDSGDSARFFAIDGAGKRLATFVYSKARVADCEEITRGPCGPAGAGDAGAAAAPSCLYIGDIGDNGEGRAGITVFRVAEPAVIADAEVPSDPLPFVYPDGAHDAEALVVHPRTGVITIVTKVKHGSSSIYEAPMPLTPGRVATLTKVGAILSPTGSPRFTAASVHPAGKGLLLRTYTHVYFAPMKPEESVASALTAPLCTVPVAAEEQGEAIAWTREGDGYVTVSEGVGAKVNRVKCAGP